MSGAHLAARPLRRHAHCPPGPSQRRCWAGLGCWSAHLPPALTGRACATRSRRYSRVWRRRRWRKQGSGGQGRVLAWTWAAAVLVVPPRTHPRCRAPMAVPRKPERANRSSAASELQTRRSTGAMWCSATQWGQWGQWEACIRQGFPRMAQGCRGVVVGGGRPRRSAGPTHPWDPPPTGPPRNLPLATQRKRAIRPLERRQPRPSGSF